MKKAMRFLAVSSLLYSPFIAAEQTFTQFSFFGDSLSDIGNQPGIRNNGSYWAQLLANRFGNTLVKSNSGGNGWANSGARTYDYQYLEDGKWKTMPGIITQVNEAIAKGPIDSHGLYSIWVGANDFNRYFVGTDPKVIIGEGVANTATAIQSLHHAGARYTMLLNLPDLAKTPQFNIFPETYRANITDMTSAYNASLATMASKVGYPIIQIDINSTFSAVIANPKRYGFDNVTDQYKLCAAEGCDVSKYLFYDEKHPTAAGNQVIYDTIMSDFQGAANAAELADAPMTTLATVNTALSNELLGLRNNRQAIPEGHYRPFVTGLYAPSLQDTQTGILSGYRQADTGLMVGVDYRWSSQLVLGAAISHSASTINFSGPGGRVKMDENLLSVFTGYQQGRFYANGIVNLGLIDYTNIYRNIPLYRAVDVATGRTSATHVGAQLEAGYDLFDDKVKSGPFATASYQYLDVEPYAESGATPGRNLQYFRMVNDSMVTGLGWQVVYPLLWKNNRISPFAQLSYNKEWLRNKNSANDMREIDVAETTLPGSHSVIPVSEIDNKGWLLANVGVNAQLNQYLFGSLSVQASLLKKSYRSYGVIGSVQFPF